MNKFTRQSRRFPLIFCRKLLLAIFPILFLVTGCARIEYQPEALETEAVATTVLSRNIGEPGFRQFVEKYGYQINTWPPAQWDFTLLTLAALYFNPDLQVAHANYELRGAEQKTAGQRLNPELNIPFEHHSDSGGDKSSWLIGLVSDLVFERSAKRQARMNRAKALKEAARINLEAESWTLRNQLLGKYIDYYSALKNKSFLHQEYELLQQSMNMLKQRYELGQVSNFEVSLVRLELQQLGLQLASQTAKVDEAFYTLINAIGLTAEGFNNKSIVFTIFDNISQKFDVSEKDVRELALQNHFSIQKALSEYQAVEEELKYEIEKQYPDIRLSPGLIFDQGDKIWALGSAWVLPLFHNNEGQIYEALARRKIKQAEFMSLQTNILNDISRFKIQLLTMKQVLDDSRGLIEGLEAQYKIIVYQYEQGHSDKLDKVRSELELIRAKQTLFKIRINVIRAMQKLENTIQHPLFDDLNLDNALGNLFNWQTSGFPELQQ